MKNYYHICNYLQLILFMQKFQTFYFEKFKFDKKNLQAKFFYSFDETEFFEEIIDFSSDFFELREDIDDDILNNILFHLHIVLWISYYKLFPTEKLIVKSWFLDEKQIKFWHKFYRNGLWEFFIKNDIDFNNILKFINFKNISDININNKVEINNDKSLLMWWWGKDSIVSSILLEKENNDFDGFVFWKIDKIKENTLKILGKKSMLVKRQLSNNLFILNKKGYYNGHVPITWIIAFASIISAYLYDYKNIVLSNEKSADEGNILWNWLDINHQYSKSKEFEDDFREYVKNNISNDINYYSKLRDKYELEIAEIFANSAQKYFNDFSSCNRNFVITWERQNKNWCCVCEKCAFVYLILASFLEEEKIISIFWENLLDKKSLENTYKGLFWLSENKPFECVWTYDESVTSAYDIIQKYKSKIKTWEIKKLPYILGVFEKDILKKYKK